MYTYSVVYPPMVNYAVPVPYIVAVVESAGGPRLTTWLVGLSPQEASIGMRVSVDVEEHDGQRPCGVSPCSERGPLVEEMIGPANSAGESSSFELRNQRRG